MKVLIILSALVAVSLAQYGLEPVAAPIPYSFNYEAPTEDGGNSGHQESGDGAGRVSGSYTVSNLEGHTRIVDYVADENGFRASIRTNEPGTASSNPADVTVESSAAEAPQYAPQYAPVAPAAPASPRYVLVPVDDPRAAGYY
ncbi:cuticle protein 10.9-like [Parasteatoda tepidariorum]|uniref:cuticle protein 10.9-like n=1 Tax=Parasteatoda tepidariorum TaxID=114398 RepID=UPI001C71D207|nr:cuticle protein 10.9-like [Parasteatoda tepidariorum]